MGTEEERPTKTRDRGRVLYRLTADQVDRMSETGIIPDGVDLELWDGLLYRMTKNDPHQYVVGTTADALRRVAPEGYHVREEKSARHGSYFLPEPDVALARGPRRAYQSQQPGLDKLALIAEVCVNTAHADREVKLPSYAEAGVPVYWLIDLARRRVEVYTRPVGFGRDARYTETNAYDNGQDLPVVIDGVEVARFAVSELLPDVGVPS